MPSSDAQSAVAALVAASVIWSLVAVGMYVWLAIALSRLFPVWGRESWKGWVPFVNTGELLSVGGYPAWQVLFLVIPFVNIYGLVILIISIHRITTRMGHGAGMTVLGVLLQPLWATLLVRGEAAHPHAAGPVVGAVPRPPAPPAPPAPAAAQEPATDTVAPPTPKAPPAALAEPTVPGAAPVQASAGVALAAPAPVPLVEPAAVERVETSVPVEASAPVTTPEQPAADVPSSPEPPAPALSLAERMGEASSGGPESRAAEPMIAPPPAASSWAAPVPAQASSASVDERRDSETSPWAPSSAAVSTPSEPAGPSADAVVTMPAFLGDPPATTAAPAEPAPADATPAVQAPSPFAPIAVLPAAAAHEAAQDDDDEEYGETVVVDRRPKIRWNLMVDGAGPMRLTADHVLLGRRPSTSDPQTQALAVPDSTRTLSKVHARLDHADDEWTITDMNSTNGVMLVAADGTETLMEAGSTAPVVGRFVLGEVGMSIAFEDGR